MFQKKNIRGLEYLERNTVSFLDEKIMCFLPKIILKCNRIPIITPVGFFFFFGTRKTDVKGYLKGKKLRTAMIILKNKRNVTEFALPRCI